MSVFEPIPCVIIESPYKATQGYSVEQHLLYLQHCIADCIKRGESPYASHRFLTAFLDDDTPRERAFGIEAGYAWGARADKIAVYTDFGVSSPGMEAAINHYKSIGKPIERRTLDRRIVDDIIRSGMV